jgi:hypothetical protein
MCYCFKQQYPKLSCQKPVSYDASDADVNKRVPSFAAAKQKICLQRAPVFKEFVIG